MMFTEAIQILLGGNGELCGIWQRSAGTSPLSRTAFIPLAFGRTKNHNNKTKPPISFLSSCLEMSRS
jgi:hypothetical protein